MVRMFKRGGGMEGWSRQTRHDLLELRPREDSAFDFTGVVPPGVPIGTDTTGQGAEGPYCV